MEHPMKLLLGTSHLTKVNVHVHDSVPILLYVYEITRTQLNVVLLANVWVYV